MKITKNHSNREAYNWLIYDINDSWIQKFNQFYTGSLVDFGCGDMPYRQYFLKYVDSYVGVDWDNSPHEKNYDINANLNNMLPIESASADTAICFSVLEHLSEPELFLSEVNRILRDDGKLILQIPFMWGVHEEPYDFVRYTRYGLQNICRKAGFFNIEIFAQSGPWSTITLKICYQLQRVVRKTRKYKFVLSILIWPLYYALQNFGRLLDKVDKNERETVGYFVVCKK